LLFLTIYDAKLIIEHLLLSQEFQVITVVVLQEGTVLAVCTRNLGLPRT